MTVDRNKMTPTRCPLVGFTGEYVLPIGSIKLLVMARMFSKQRIVMVKFLVVDRPTAYSVVIGKAADVCFK
jgi:hypothetical protein